MTQSGLYGVCQVGERPNTIGERSPNALHATSVTGLWTGSATLIHVSQIWQHALGATSAHYDAGRIALIGPILRRMVELGRKAPLLHATWPNICRSRSCALQHSMLTWRVAYRQVCCPKREEDDSKSSRCRWHSSTSRSSWSSGTRSQSWSLCRRECCRSCPASWFHAAWLLIVACAHTVAAIAETRKRVQTRSSTSERDEGTMTREAQSGRRRRRRPMWIGGKRSTPVPSK